MIRAASLLVLAAASATSAVAGGLGIAIRPDNAGVFEYSDDYSTPKFLLDAVSTNVPPDCWSKGALTSNGPHRNRTVTYRFHGDRVIETLEVRVEQWANARNLGSANYLYVSPNGLDWTLAATSQTQQADANGWQQGPLTLSPDSAATLAGNSEVWIRLVLDNWCGLQSNTSNILRNLQVKIRVGASAVQKEDPQLALKEVWAESRQNAGWKSLSLDWADPQGKRAPHYYEGPDGWLEEPQGEHLLVIDERNGFRIRRAYLNEGRSPLSLATFVGTDQTRGPVLARVEIAAEPGSSRKVDVLWRGNTIAAFDAASAIPQEKVIFARMEGPHQTGVHELRLAPRDSGELLVKRITLAGAGSLRWASKPKTATGRELQVLSASYLPDPLPPPDSQAVEGRHEKQEVGLIIQGLQQLYREHADFGALRVVVRNTSKSPLRLGRLSLNGRPLEDSYVDLMKGPWDARGVVWYRVRPRLLLPKQCAQVTVRFRRRPEGEQATLVLHLEIGKSVEVRVPYTDPGLRIDYATTGKAMDTLYVYVRRANPEVGRLTSLSFDGEPLKRARIFGGDFPGNVALVCAKLDRPLGQGEYHVVGATTDAGKAVAAQFRVLPFTFVRSSIHIPAELCRPMHMNLAMWSTESLETCREHRILTTTAGSMFDLHDRVAFVIGPDEPDAQDNIGGGYANGLGYHARRLAESGWQELIERFAPQAASWIIMDGTVRPLNWCVYGQFADVCCFDPYPINFYGADHAYVRESLGFARRCGAPNRMFACLEAFGWQAGQGVPTGARGPIPAEWRQNVVQAIGCGMKGLTSWVYAAGAGGWEINEPVRKETSAMNALIEHIEGDLLLGTPVDLASCDAGTVPTGVVGDERWPKERVWVSSLLCGPDAIVVAAANHIPASKPAVPQVVSAKDVTITIALPDYLRNVMGFEATPEGLEPFPCQVVGTKALLKVPVLESGRVFVLRRK